MALVTIGTNATSTLSGVQWLNKVSQIADIAQISAGVLTQGTVQKTVPGAFANNGILYLPTRRGIVQMLPGDWIAIGSTGMPIVISARAKTADWTSA